MENSAQIFNLLSDLPGEIQDIDLLLEVSHHARPSHLMKIFIKSGAFCIKI